MPGSAVITEAYHFGPWLTGIIGNLGFVSLGLMASMTLFAEVTWITPELQNGLSLALISLTYVTSTAVYMWQHMEAIRLFGTNGAIVVVLVALILVPYLILYGASIIPLSMGLVTLGLFVSVKILADFLKDFQDMKDEHKKPRGSVIPQDQGNELYDPTAGDLPVEHALPPALRDHGLKLTRSHLEFVTNHTGPSNLDLELLRRDSLSSRVNSLVLHSTAASTTSSVKRCLQKIDGSILPEVPDDNPSNLDLDDHDFYQNGTGFGLSGEYQAQPG